MTRCVCYVITMIIWFIRHNRLSMIVTDGLVPIWHQNSCNNHNIGQSGLIRNLTRNGWYFARHRDIVLTQQKRSYCLTICCLIEVVRWHREVILNWIEASYLSWCWIHVFSVTKGDSLTNFLGKYRQVFFLCVVLFCFYKTYLLYARVTQRSFGISRLNLKIHLCVAYIIAGFNQAVVSVIL